MARRTGVAGIAHLLTDVARSDKLADKFDSLLILVIAAGATPACASKMVPKKHGSNTDRTCLERASSTRGPKSRMGRYLQERGLLRIGGIGGHQEAFVIHRVLVACKPQQETRLGVGTLDGEELPEGRSQGPGVEAGRKVTAKPLSRSSSAAGLPEPSPARGGTNHTLNRKWMTSPSATG